MVNNVRFIVVNIGKFGVNNAANDLVGSIRKRVGVVMDIVDDKVEDKWVFGKG
jgi:hypothetical protein